MTSPAQEVAPAAIRIRTATYTPTHVPYHPHDHVSITRHLDGPVAGASVETWIRARPGGVVRAKGLVRPADRPDDRTVLQVCGSNSTVTVDGSWDGGDLVVVAIALPGTPRAALVKWLNLLA